jgi:hypothetical protein
MGYEIIYSFHPKDEEGSYKKDEVKELKKKLGEPFEDVLLDKLASTIMSQLARRDIWIFDVKIYELVKREISFRETKGGIVIKNKKFLLDGEMNIVVQEMDEVPAKPQNGLVNIAAQPNGGMINLAGPQRPQRPIKWVALDPDLPNLDKVKSSGLAFTPDKRYPVFSESTHPKKFGVMIYVMMDDNKREVTLEDTYFLNADQILQQGFVSSVDQEVGVPKLKFDDSYKDIIPDIRGRR